MAGQIICCAGRVWGYVASMDWQQLVSLAIVAAAAACWLRGSLRRRKFSFERERIAAALRVLGPQGSIVFRARKGERPESW